MKKVFILLVLLSTISAAFSQASSRNAIEETTSPKGWIIHTKSSVYQLVVNDNGMVIPVYFGDAAQASFKKKNPLWNNKIAEVPVRGGFANKKPALEVVFRDNVRDLELKFKSGEIINIDGYPTLKITQVDKFYPLQIVSYIRAIPQFDIIEKWIEVSNTGGKESIRIENLQSASIALPADAYELNYVSGYWGHEYQPQVDLLTPGTKTLEVRDFKSYGTPSFIVGKQNTIRETSGQLWFGSLQYSGNWRIDFDKSPEGELQIIGGINFWDSWWNLLPREKFTTPKFIFGYTELGKEGVAHNLTGYEKQMLMPENTVSKLRPVLYNSWYATEFNVNEKDQLALAAIAKSIGVEMFVIDDGWFKGRINDAGGLGDWTVDLNKFPDGLRPLIKKVNDLGLDFGLWIEPEMTNPNSDLYRAHPDWVLNFPNRTRNETRNQLVLNLARQDVYDYLHKVLYNLLKDHNIKYLKWDMNRPLSEPGWPAASNDMQREVRIRYVKNLYKLIDELRKEFPGVWIENCSSGGGRVDQGMLSRTDVFWASDNTDPIDRIFIQYSYLGFFPANTMISWTTQEDAHHQQPSLAYKFDVAMSGVLGVGYDITKWSVEERALAAEKIEKYKQIRPLVNNGDLYRLVSPYEHNRSALQFVSKDKKEAVLCLYNLSENMQGATKDTRGNDILQLRGIDPKASYKVEGDPEVYTGSYLMNIGVKWPVDGSFKSKILSVKMVD